MKRLACALLALGCLFAWSPMARAQVRMILTIEGDIQELIEILQHLRKAGLGGGKNEEGQDKIRIEMHSSHHTTAIRVKEPEAADAPAPPPPKPAAKFRGPTVEPYAVNAGQNVLISVETVDKKRLIDTISATLPLIAGCIDLTDDGTRGDCIPGDHVWSAEITVPEEAEIGRHTVEIMAYAATGAPLVLEGEETPLTTVAFITVEGGVPSPAEAVTEAVAELLPEAVEQHREQYGTEAGKEN